MSYANAQALQAAVYQALVSDAAVAALVGTAIYDTVPSGDVPPLYVSLGPEQAQDASDKTGRGALHRFMVSVTSDQSSFSTSLAVAAAICDALIDAPLTLARGRLVSLTFDRATATRRKDNTGRQIDLRFRARTEDI